MSSALKSALEAVLHTHPLRAGRFIVTLYGDVAAPRGGGLWMSDIISVCALAGLSETLVRTAVSRLVNEGQLVGRRQGRRSFYRLTVPAGQEYLRAAVRIYERPVGTAWRLLLFPSADAETRLAALAQPAAQVLTPFLAFGPATDDMPDGAVTLAGELSGAPADIHAICASIWPLHTLRQDYETFLSLADALSQHSPTSPMEALLLRLILVHHFRAVALADPLLPLEALPEDWVGHLARTRFAQIYLALSDLADSHISTDFDGVDAPLLARPPEVEQRLKTLREWLRR